MHDMILKTFDPKKADAIFQEEGETPSWLAELIEYPTWRSLIYRLAEDYPDCLMLNFTIKLISDAGFQVGSLLLKEFHADGLSVKAIRNLVAPTCSEVTTLISRLEMKSDVELTMPHCRAKSRPYRRLRNKLRCFPEF